MPSLQIESGGIRFERLLVGQNSCLVKGLGSWNCCFLLGSAEEEL